MSDYIERDKAIDTLDKDPMGGLNYNRILNNLPSAEKTGKWINCKYPLGECSECHAIVDIQNNEANNCPVCGSRNRGEEE